MSEDQSILIFNAEIDRMLGIEQPEPTPHSEIPDELNKAVAAARRLHESSFQSEIRPQPRLRARWLSESIRLNARPYPSQSRRTIWIWAVITAIVLIAGLVAFRQPVFTAVGRLFGYGYIPQVGFVQLDTAQVLRSPARADEIIPVQPTPGAQPPSNSQNGVRLVLDNVAPASDKTILQVSIKYDRPNTSIAGRWDIRLSDQAGMLYPLKDITPGTMNSGDTRIYETSPFSGTEQLTFSLIIFPGGDVLPMIEDFSTEAPGFIFDPGVSPQAGQTWKLNETVHVGSFTLHVVRATLTDGTSLVFEFEPAENVTGAMVYTTDPLLRSSGGGDAPVQVGNFTARMTFEKIPSQPFKVVISRVSYTAKGPWQLQWQPPAAPTPAANRPTSTASPTLAPLATPTQVSDPVALEVQQLAQKFESPLHQGPGWVQVVSENIATPRAGQTYPPPYLKTELWYEIDADGYITRMLQTDRNKNGQILQQAATVGNYSINFTYGSAGFNDGKRYRVSLDNLTGSLGRAAQDTQKITQVLREQSTCENGNACLLITIRAYFPAPIQNPGEAEAYYGSVERTWIDTQTGQQVKVEGSWLLKDDQETVTSTHRVLAIEKVAAPPQEILDVLAKVVVP